jgi:IS605 OrfB family transposase
MEGNNKVFVSASLLPLYEINPYNFQLVLKNGKSKNKIIFEKLPHPGISNMMKNSRLSRAIADVSWFSFKEMLSYKCKQTGKNLLVIGKFEPSSKLCPCGQLNNDLTLKDRNWTCKYCKVTHDRDLLAANNIKHFAFIKEKIPQELRESKPVESCISSLKKQET